MSNTDPRTHITATYFTLRAGLAAAALLFPLLLFGLGRFRSDLTLQASMSAYYHNAATRDVFVGVLFAIGFGLWAYKGFTDPENWALNAAGIFALGVALFPTAWNCKPNCPRLTVHATLAVLFFACIAYVAVFRAVDTVKLLEEEGRDTEAKWFRAAYRALGVAMIGLPALAALLSTALKTPDRESTRVFWVEFGAVYAFAAYWIVKSVEISITQVERRAAEGELATQPPATAKAIAKPFATRPVVSTRPDAKRSSKRKPAGDA